MRYPVLVAILAGCKHVDPAPSDVDGLARWFWDNYDQAEDADVAAAMVNVHAAIDADALVDPIDGTVSDLTVDDITGVEIADGTDPTAAAGMFLTDMIPCSLAEIEGIATALNQDQLYVGVYDAYTREYTTDSAAYFDRQTPTVAWAVEIDSKLLGTNYHESLLGGARYVADLGADVTPNGPILVTRTWMPSPAVFESGNKSFDQDYQIEIYDERAPGETIHLYALWRKLDMTSGLDQDNTTVQRTILNNLVDWDAGTAQICADARQ